MNRILMISGLVVASVAAAQPVVTSCQGLPRSVPVVEHGAPPPCYHDEPRTRLAVVIPGGAAFLASWLYGATTALTLSFSRSLVDSQLNLVGSAFGAAPIQHPQVEPALLFVPIGGPVMAANAGLLDAGTAAALVTVQVAGLVVAGVGLLFPRHQWLLDGPVKLTAGPTGLRGTF